MIKSKEELIAFACQVLSEEFNFEVDSYTKKELREIKGLIELILTKEGK